MAGQLEHILEQLEQGDMHDRAVLSSTLGYLDDLHMPASSTQPLTMDSISSTDAALHLIDALVPGWTIHITGKALETDGHWKCTLRRSSSLDNDEFVGSGKGKLLLNAVLAAMLRTVSYFSGNRELS